VTIAYTADTDLNAFHVHQSIASLAPSTLSASSGYTDPQRDILHQTATQFQDSFPTLRCSFPNGDLDEAALKQAYPVVGGMLPFFVIMATTLLYHSPLVQSWPDSESLRQLSLLAIGVVRTAHIQGSTDVPETCKYSRFGFEKALTNTISGI